ncbi:MAG: hypothetical protein JNM00_12570, partial [Flavobacteriales bacterium]|nr:hypothetical protein [Flavobacteriales bacterium]
MAHEQYDSGKYEEALETLRKLGKEDLAPEAYLLRADCMHKLDRQVEALNDYDRAKILGLNNEQLFLNRGICKTTLGY